MSYCRKPLYAWASSHHMHLWVREDHPTDCGVLADPENYEMAGGVHIPHDLFDQLVICRYAELVREGTVAKLAKKAAAKGSPFHGNFGSWDLREALGEDPAEELNQKIKAARNDGEGR